MVDLHLACLLVVLLYYTENNKYSLLPSAILAGSYFQALLVILNMG